MASKLAPLLLRASARTLRPTRLVQHRGFVASARVASDAIMVHRNSDVNNPNIPFKFNTQNEELIKIIIARYPSQYKKAAVMPLLDLGQRQLGWCSISVMNEVARILEMPPMRVYEVATFYTMYNRDPVGKFHVQVCTTTPCQLCGSDAVMKAVKETLGVVPGHTTDDGLFTFTEVECLGACVNGPMLQINDDYYEDLTGETTTQLLKALQEAHKVTGLEGQAPGLGGGEGGKGALTGVDNNVKGGHAINEQGRSYSAQGVTIPTPGPLSGRKTCENSKGITSLKEVKEWGKGEGMMRTDGALD